ncbi:branched-chain amino acid aminotransferase [Micromonospora sp. KLBMP9576]|uniref:branched-chain amino acid aminotransferase n=1 Tax=Micromonospora sp. KLBMP9576 TaxID=3424769 RepID=UPI003D8C5EC4
MTQAIAGPDRAASTARLEFGSAFTDHMVMSTWQADQGWQRLRLQPRGLLSVDPACVGLHYGQAVFEGLKAHRLDDGTVAAFRPAQHAHRMRISARRLSIPPLSAADFLQAVDLLVEADGPQLPADPTLSMYLRPLLVATEANLALRPAREYTFVLQAFLTGGFFADQPDPVSVWISHDHVRAIPGGTGDVKYAGNYAPTYLAQAVAVEHGCQQVVWLDAVHRRWVEEMGGMNLFFVRGRGGDAEVLTPPLTGGLLPGVTRDTLLTLAARMGLNPREEPISVDEWRSGCAEGRITEAFACGTGAGVTPVGVVKDGHSGWTIGDGRAGPVTLALRNALLARQYGRLPDPDGWLRRAAAPASAGDERA